MTGCEGMKQIKKKRKKRSDVGLVGNHYKYYIYGCNDGTKNHKMNRSAHCTFWDLII